MKGSSSEHATAVLVGPRAVLIRGKAGAGKSQLAWSLMEAASNGELLLARLIADDRVALSAINGKLIAAAPKQIAGMIELRGLGVRKVPFEPFAVVGLVVDLGADDAERIPSESARQTDILGVTLPRLPIAANAQAMPILLNVLNELNPRG